jgi:hypothetical protein
MGRAEAKALLDGSSGEVGGTGQVDQHALEQALVAGVRRAGAAGGGAAELRAPPLERVTPAGTHRPWQQALGHDEGARAAPTGARGALPLEDNLVHRLSRLPHAAS